MKRIRMALLTLLTFLTCSATAFADIVEPDGFDDGGNNNSAPVVLIAVAIVVIVLVVRAKKK